MGTDFGRSGAPSGRVVRRSRAVELAGDPGGHHSGQDRSPPADTDAQGKPFQDRIGAPVAAPERMVSREEQPVALPTPPRSVAPSAAFAPAASAPLVPPQPPAAVANEPKRVKTMTIRADSDPTSAAPAQTSQPRAQERGRACLEEFRLKVASGDLPSNADLNRYVAWCIGADGSSSMVWPNASQPVTLPPAAAAPPSSATAVPTVPTPSRSAAPAVAYVVQVSAQRTEAEAQSSYRALQQKYPAVLGSREAYFRRVDLGEKDGIFYRAQVGSFATSEQATAFCDNLKTAGGQCIVQRHDWGGPGPGEPPAATVVPNGVQTQTAKPSDWPELPQPPPRFSLLPPAQHLDTTATPATDAAFSATELLAGKTISETECRTLRLAVWVVVQSRGECIRYYHSAAGGTRERRARVPARRRGVDQRARRSEGIRLLCEGDSGLFAQQQRELVAQLADAVH